MHINLDIVRIEEYHILIDMLSSEKYFSENKSKKSEQIQILLQKFQREFELVSVRNDLSEIIAFIAISDNCIEYLYVSPENRNNGIGSSLLAYALENLETSTAIIPKNDHIRYSLFSKFGFFIENGNYAINSLLLKHIYHHVIEINPELSLKYVCYDDASDIYTTIDSQREYLGVWLSFVERTRRIEHTISFIESALDIAVSNKTFVFSILFKNNFAGIVGLSNVDTINRRAEIGCWLSQGFQGQGIATMSVRAMQEFAFNKLNLHRIQVKVATGNEVSRKIPQRLQYKFEGTERGGELLSGNNFVDMEVYSKLKSD